MYRRRRKLGGAPVLFPQVGRIVVSQPIIEREPAGHFPRVLGIDPQLLFAHARERGVTDAYRIDLAQQETGVSESDVSAGNGRALEGLAGLCCREIVAAGGVPANPRWISFRSEFRSEFIAMVVFDPVESRVEGWSLGNVIGRRRRTEV